MKMTLKVTDMEFNLEFDTMEEGCQFINMFLRNNPEASLIRLERREKQEMLNQAANSVAEILGVNKEDPTLKAAIEVAGSLIGLNKYDN
jgi:hypothetical protein